MYSDMLVTIKHTIMLWYINTLNPKHKVDSTITTKVPSMLLKHHALSYENKILISTTITS